jgi:hypothetical protein
MDLKAQLQQRLLAFSGTDLRAAGYLLLPTLNGLTCDFVPIRSLARPVSLAEIKAESRLTEMGLVRQPRLAVLPLTVQEFDIIANERANNSME